jgi:outer membrane protein TolC
MIHFFLAIVMLLLLYSNAILRAEILPLAEAERIAVTNALEIQVTQLELKSMEWGKWNAIANYLPSLSYNGNYLRMDERTVDYANRAFDLMVANLPPGIPVPENPNPLYENSFSHEFSLNQPISNGGAEIFAIEIAKHAKRAAELEQEATRHDVIYNTRKAYFDAISSAERTKLEQRYLLWAEQNLSKSQTRYDSGTVPITDLLQWEAEVVQKESDLLQAKATERFLLLTLFQTMGVPPEEVDTTKVLQQLETFEDWYKRERIPLDGSIDYSIDNNPRYQSIREYTKVVKGNKKLALSRFLPKLNAFYTYSWPAWNKLKPWEERRGWTAGISLSVPLFSGLRNSTSYQQAKYDYKKTVTEEEQIKRQLELNLERIELFQRASVEGVKAALKQRELMDKQLTIMQKRYEGGLINQSQLLEVALAAHQTRIVYILKLFECLLLEAEYLKNKGELEVAQ